MRIYDIYLYDAKTVEFALYNIKVFY